MKLPFKCRRELLKRIHTATQHILKRLHLVILSSMRLLMMTIVNHDFCPPWAGWGWVGWWWWSSSSSCCITWQSWWSWWDNYDGDDNDDDDEDDDDNDDNSHPGGVVSQGNLTVPPTKPLVDLITGPVIVKSKFLI